MQHKSTSSTHRSDNGSSESWLSRRQILGAVGSAGMAGAAWGLASSRGLLVDRARIVYARARPDPGTDELEPRTKDVPLEWFQQLQLAFDVQAKLEQSGLSSLVGSFIVPGDFDNPGASISIDTTDDAIRGPIDELAQEIPIDVTIVDDLLPAREHEPTISEAAQIPDMDQKEVPSGYVCTANDWYGTIASAVYDARQGSRFFATSNHLFGDKGTKETEHAGEPLSLLRDGTDHPIGRVRRGYPAADVVQIVPIDGYRPAPAIGRASPGTVIGQYTKVGLADLMARGEPLSKVGALSDHTVGKIKGVDGITCYTGEVCKPGQLKWGSEETIVDGDSGSVSYHVDPEHPDSYVLVAGINNARTWWPGMDFSWGTAGYQLYNEYGLHF